MSSYEPSSPEWMAENRGRPLRDTAIAFIVLQAFFVVLFFVARNAKKTLWAADVFLILLGYVWSLLVAVAALGMVKIGFGRHLIVVMQENYTDLVTGLKFMLLQEYSYICAVTFPKLAILCLYLRLFHTPVYRGIIYAIGFTMIASLVALIITNFFVCKPFAYNWDKTIPGGRCGDLVLLFKLVSMPNILTDLPILILPIPVVWKLSMKASQKIGLTLTFLTGSFGMLTAIFRLYYFSTVKNLFADFTYDHIITECWTVIEPSCYLIAAILPSLRPVLKMVNESPRYASLKSRIKVYASWPSSRATYSMTRDEDPSSRKTQGQLTTVEEVPTMSKNWAYVIERGPSVEISFDLEGQNAVYREK